MPFNKDRYQALREASRKGRAKLAQETGLNYYTIRAYDRGQHGPSERSAKLLAKALNCDVREFWPDFPE